MSKTPLFRVNFQNVCNPTPETNLTKKLRYDHKDIMECTIIFRSTYYSKLKASV